MRHHILAELERQREKNQHVDRIETIELILNTISSSCLFFSLVHVDWIEKHRVFSLNTQAVNLIKAIKGASK